ncbi:MAG: metal-sensitive transcriptional regulator [Deltaproteobacteria bacterium]|nr:metal-sensitive transcriptional regulator [Deltaproteobacteria bacterium]
MHESQLAQLNLIGNQIRGITRMITDGGYCINILTEIRSASRTMSQVEYNIFKNHLESCVRRSISEGDSFERDARINEVQDLLAKAK